MLDVVETPPVLKAKKPKNKSQKSSTSPMQRTLKHLRKQGYLCAIVEKWNAHMKIRQDMFGFIDVVAIKGEDILGVQTTSASHFSEHKLKIVEHPNWPAVCKAMRVILHGWRKNSEGKWILTEEEL